MDRQFLWPIVLAVTLIVIATFMIGMEVGLWTESACIQSRCAVGECVKCVEWQTDGDGNRQCIEAVCAPGLDGGQGG